MEKEIQWLLKEKYHNKPNKKFDTDVQRLKKGEPLDYVIGFTEFLGCKINLSKKPLIPRQETEFWVAGVMEEVQKKKNAKVLDIFSGSGCIGVSIMRHSASSHITFVDVSSSALGQIKLNCTLNRINKTRCKIVKSDVFSNIKGKFDYIFANPPYIPTTRKHKVQRSVLDYEPQEALFGGGDGMRYIKKFLSKAKDHMHYGGKIYMEFDPIQKKLIEQLAKKNNYNDISFGKDQFGKWRYCVLR